ncbi:MAG TPA: hypothetical protein PKD24_02175 [Pyrinomonadaceae bacterium]|nr:hypothetical protein [Pyrinomonadaceae bacterium]HMP64034.1 hypothetical protein [Pyrinomonadaceae bacterium]
MKTTIINKNFITETLEHLQKDGRRGVEGVVLWLAGSDSDQIRINQVYRPEQHASWGNFRIPRSSMMGLLRHLRATGSSIAAQVHSHPEEAFHSPIDDEWAIIRHTGALSLVLPDYALRTSLDTFIAHTAVYELSAVNKWEEVAPDYVINKYRIVSE